jgi:hypothetical protein
VPSASTAHADNGSACLQKTDTIACTHLLSQAVVQVLLQYVTRADKFLPLVLAMALFKLPDQVGAPRVVVWCQIGMHGAQEECRLSLLEGRPYSLSKCTVILASLLTLWDLKTRVRDNGFALALVHNLSAQWTLAYLQALARQKAETKRNEIIHKRTLRQHSFGVPVLQVVTPQLGQT